MAELYRSTRDLQHWFVLMPGAGWSQFPPKIDGWSDRQPVIMLSREHLHLVPLWMAFNTGLLEAIARQDLERAA